MFQIGKDPSSNGPEATHLVKVLSQSPGLEEIMPNALITDGTPESLLELS
jgi:hypothetical protein